MLAFEVTAIDPLQPFTLNRKRTLTASEADAHSSSVGAEIAQDAASPCVASLNMDQAVKSACWSSYSPLRDLDAL